MTGDAGSAAGTAVLYDYWRSSASWRLRIGLALKRCAHKTVPVDLRAGEQGRAAHLARSPQGLVPVLDIDGRRFIQSLAALEYLEETRPAPPLLPPPGEAENRARVRALAYAVAADIHPVCNLRVVNYVRAAAGGGDGAGDESVKAWMRRFIGPGLDAVEILLDHPRLGRFCDGDAPGLADCCLAPQVYNAARWGLDIAAWPRIQQVDANCRTHPAFAATHPDRVKPH